MKRALLVEDDPSLAAHWAEILGEGGWTVTIASSAREALEQTGPFDVLFCEAELPDTSGLELARDLRRLQPSLRILLAAASMPDRVPGDVRVLMKPFPADRLLAVLEDLPAPTPSGGLAGDTGRRTGVGAMAAAILFVFLAAIGSWWGLREEPLPAPSGPEVLRGGELRALEPRGPVGNLDELRWTPSEGAARYVVWVRRLDDSVVWQTSAAEERVDVTDAGLEPGVPYRWEVEAFDGAGRRIGLSEGVDFQLSEESR